MNRRLLTLGVAAATAACALLTGCGSKTVTTGSSGTTRSAGSAPMSPAPGTPAPTPGSSTGGKVSRTPIGTTVGVVDAGRELTVSAVTSGCKTAQLLASESGASVTLTLQMTDHHQPGHMCPNFAKNTQLHVMLKAPLAKRHLVDGVTGRTLSTGG